MQFSPIKGQDTQWCFQLFMTAGDRGWSVYTAKQADTLIDVSLMYVNIAMSTN